ncbi:MAG: hypothetical protein M1839_003062 [Geoglossum umbratile]|nr:MAG: hypothetical protein M1839_003062 [Geoglossum umbratile]
MASAEMIPKTAPTSSKPNTPPQTPTQPVGPIISPHHIQQLLEILSRAVPSKEESKEESKPAGTGVDNENEKGPKARASKLEFKMVNEAWSNSAYKYIIAESQECPTKEDDKWVEYIFVIRKKFDKENKYCTEYVDVKSEGLQDILREILKDVNGVSLREDKPSVHPALLLTYLPQLEAYQAVHSMHTSIRHLNLLTQYLTDHYDATLKRFNALLEEGKISFDLLWILFQPNTLVYTTCPGSDQPRCLKFDFGQMEQSSQGECFFKLDCRYLDYDGKVFGEVETSLAVTEFRGVKKINTLHVFPLQYHEQAERLKDALAARGRKFISLIGIHHCNYKGIAFAKPKGKYDKVYVENRVMIDAGEFKQINPNYNSSRINSRTDLFEESFLYDRILGWDSFSSKDSKAVKTNGIAPNETKKEDLLLCSPTVLGFSFSNKLWLEFSVAHIGDIIWDPSPFENLVLPDEQKNIIRALAESQNIETDKPFDDFVKGKGQGLVILLHGPAGVGKTLTAEGISEFLKRPLYTVCAGDLGVDSSKLEAKLSSILHLARHWNAILLLDEADVFLEERTLHDTNRNALVSVFLRQVEYFQGTMFLTTNRVKTLDEAFQSRIHFALRYRKLGKSAREKVWVAFLQRSGASYVKSSELGKLIEKDINGRQIKNAVRTAHALAMNEGEDMSYKHLETVIDATADFDRDFKGSGYIENMRSYT